MDDYLVTSLNAGEVCLCCRLLLAMLTVISTAVQDLGVQKVRLCDIMTGLGIVH
uniref:Uncharacterized protein n=1 Tax=Anguilla anguilla TaxID=7936 RepID=A0A0E9WRJ6_ANGAN